MGEAFETRSTCSNGSAASSRASSKASSRASSCTSSRQSSRQSSKSSVSRRCGPPAAGAGGIITARGGSRAFSECSNDQSISTMSAMDWGINLEGQDLVTLLKCSLPTPLLGAEQGKYCLHLRRASPRQTFGISFSFNSATAQRPSCILVAENLPHLGIRKTDELVVLNRTRPKTLAQCREILQTAMSIVMVLRRREVFAAPQKRASGCCSGFCSWWCCCCECCECGSEDGVGCCPKHLPQPELTCQLLAITRPAFVEQAKGIFTLSIQRAALRQRFGIGFTADQNRPGSRETRIRVTEDVEYMWLRKGDRLLKVNGVHPRSWKECKRILDSSTIFRMIFYRSPYQLNDLSIQVESIDQPPAQQEVHVEEVPCEPPQKVREVSAMPHYSCSLPTSTPSKGCGLPEFSYEKHVLCTSPPA